MTKKTNHKFEFLVRLADNNLVLGQRVSEWCGKAPTLEEDIALANISLDLIGQSKLWLEYAAETEKKGRSADDLAFLRDPIDFRNLLIVEQPNTDFGFTIMRQFLFDAMNEPMLNCLKKSKDQRVAEIASKSHKEVTYHLERSRDTVIALGDGTDESNSRMQNALNNLWQFVGEFFEEDEVDEVMSKNKVASKPKTTKPMWEKIVSQTLKEAQLSQPKNQFGQVSFGQVGGRNGTRHTEHLGHMLATMQILQRSHPGAVW